MTGADKAAILLLYLGAEVTAKVYEHMEDEEIKKISKSMAHLGHVPRHTIVQVVDDFNEVISPESGIFAQGEEFVRKILEKALGPAKAEILGWRSCKPQPMATWSISWLPWTRKVSPIFSRRSIHKPLP